MAVQSYSSQVRALFCCRPAHGHVNPLLPLALACRDAGHDVLFGTGAQFVPRLRELGFRAERVGISIEEADRQVLEASPELIELPREQRWRIGVEVFARTVPRHTMADLGPLLAEAAPDLVVYDETDLGVPVAAASAGVPAVAHSLGRQLPDAIREPVLAALGEGDLFAAHAYVDICPPSLQDPAAADPTQRIPLRPVAPVDAGDVLPGWIGVKRTRPLVYLTLGTYVSGQVGSLRAAATGVGTLDVDALVTVGPGGDPAALGALPDSIRVERYVPQGVLLPHLDVVAHHGGQRHDARRARPRAPPAGAAAWRGPVHQLPGADRQRRRPAAAAGGDRRRVRRRSAQGAARRPELPGCR